MEENICTMPRIGENAPEFTAQTTQGTIHFPNGYNGKWIIFFSHPADFTPVCTSEFMTFGRMQEEFEALNCQLVGLSIDGLSSHIAWLHTIGKQIEWKGMKNIEIRFPLIDDITMSVAKRYGMIQPGESESRAVRAVFFIDPKGIIRAIIYYPLSLGRNFDEIKRVLTGLQITDAFGVSTPADWRPGDDVIVPAPNTMQRLKEREAAIKSGEITSHDWFFCTKKLSKEEIEKKLGIK